MVLFFLNFHVEFVFTHIAFCPSSAHMQWHASVLDCQSKWDRRLRSLTKTDIITSIGPYLWFTCDHWSEIRYNEHTDCTLAVSGNMMKQGSGQVRRAHIRRGRGNEVANNSYPCMIATHGSLRYCFSRSSCSYSSSCSSSSYSLLLSTSSPPHPHHLLPTREALYK